MIQKLFINPNILGKVNGVGQIMAIDPSELVQPWLDQEQEIWKAAYNGPNSFTGGGIPASIAKIAAKSDAHGLNSTVY